MLAPHTRESITRQVAQQLGCQPADVVTPGVRVVSHGAWLADYRGVYAWVMGAAAIVSVPSDWVATVGQAALPDTPEDALDAAFWHTVLGPVVERIVGPAYQSYVDTAAFQPAPDVGARLLGVADRPALERLAAACDPVEWEHSAITAEQTPIFGLERTGALVAAAAYKEKGPGVVTVGVITHPAFRRAGYGRAAVSALTAYGLEQGVVCHYQTLRANAGSLAIARALGYQDLASTMAIRLRQTR
jgi:GNAT superfamily N-acetyltransferase